jgi:hypothetical protein
MQSRSKTGLDGDAVLVAACDLHDRRIADARQQGADADRRHMAVSARRIDGVDAVDPAVEDRGALVDVLGIGAIGRVQLGGNGKFAAAEHTLQPTERGVAGKGIERQVGAKRVFVDMRHRVSVPWSGRRGQRQPRL